MSSLNAFCSSERSFFQVRAPIVVFRESYNLPYHRIGIALKDMSVNYFLLELLFFLFDTTTWFLDLLSLVFLFL